MEKYLFILNIRNIYHWCPTTWYFTSNFYKQRIKIVWSDAHTHTPEHTPLHFTANVSLSVSLGPLFWSSETAVNSLCCQFEEHFLRGQHEVTVATCVFHIQSLFSWILENLNNNHRDLWQSFEIFVNFTVRYETFLVYLRPTKSQI